MPKRVRFNRRDKTWLHGLITSPGFKEELALDSAWYRNGGSSVVWIFAVNAYRSGITEAGALLQELKSRLTDFPHSGGSVQ
jgi:hypothetical protein